MSTLDDPQASSPSARSRLERAADLLLRNEQISINKLAEEFEIDIKRTEDSQLATLWQSGENDSTALPESSQAWRPERWSQTSALGDALKRAQSSRGSKTDIESSAQESIIVLLSDGQNIP